MASITTEGRNELIALYTAMFNAVPGFTNLSEIVLLRESGKTLLEVSNFLTGKPDFSKVYPGLMTADEFTARLVSSMLGSEVSSSASTWASNWVKAQLASGKGPAFVFSEAVKAIRSTTNPDFKLAKDMLANKVDVGTFFAVTKGLDGTLAVLQDQIDTVTSSTATSQAVKTEIEASVNPPSYALAAAAASVNEGASLAFTLSTTNVANGTSVPYTISGVSAADVTGALTGNAVVGADGKATITVAVAADRTTEGAETLTVTAAGKSASATVNDTSLNPVYTVTAGAASVNEGSSATFTVGSTGVDAGTMVDYTISGVSAADVTGGMLAGKATIGTDGKATITVALANDQTTETAETVTVTVGAATASTAVVDTSVTPVLATDTASGTIVSGQGTAIVVPASLLTNDTGSDGKALTGTPTLVAASATNGEIFTTKDGNFLFVANSGSRTGSFQYEVAGTNGKGTVNVLLNSAPSVTTTALAATEDTKATGTVTATDADSDALTYSYEAKNGTVTGTTGSFEYTPNANFNGADTITVTVKDGFTTVTKDIAVTVAAVDDAPAAVSPAPAAVSVNAGSTVTVDLTKYATDIDSSSLTYTAGSATTTKGGTVTVAGSTATINYSATKGAAALGTDSFTITATDGTTPIAGVPVSLNVVNTAPTATSFGLSARTGVTQTVDLTGKATDAEGNTLTPVVTVGSVSSGGSAEVLDGKIVYTSTIGFVGTETVKYTVTDAFGGSSTEQTITFTVASNTGGTSGNDLLYGSTAAEAIDGLLGNDTINGGGGADTITGGDGNDTVTYNDNAKQIFGGNGLDNLVINSDAIAAKFDLGSATDQVTDASNTTIIVRGFENVDATKSSNAITIDAVNADTTSLILSGQGDTITTMAAATSTGIVVNTAAGNDSITVGASTGTFNIDGGAGNDTIDESASTKNNTIMGGDGNDTITLGSGVANVSAGAGTDTVKVTDANLTSADTITGGDGTDTIEITDTASIADADLTNVLTVEGIKLAAGAGAQTVALSTQAQEAGIISVDGSLSTQDVTVTLGTGVTSGVTIIANSADNSITGGAGNDIIVTNATSQLNFTATGDDSVTGGAGTDQIRIDNDSSTDGTGNAVTITVGSGLVSGVEQFVINDTATDNAAGDVTVTFIGAYAVTSGLTIDGSALDAGEVLTVDTSANTTSETVTITGGAAADVFTLSSIADSVAGGEGADSFKYAEANLASGDSVNGGGGTDTLEYTDAATLVDVELTNFTSVETIKLAAGAASQSLTIGTEALEAGITTIDARTSAQDVTVVVQTGYTAGVTILATSADNSITGGAGNDIIATNATSQLNFTATGDDSVTGGAGTDQIRIDNDSSTDGTGNAVTITVGSGLVSGVEQFVINDTATDNAAGDVTVTFIGAYAVTSGLTIDGSALDAGEVLTVDTSANTTDERVTITGGAAADVFTLSSIADSVAGGDGTDSFKYAEANLASGDSVNGGAGNDTLEYTDAATLVDVELTNFTSVEIIKLAAGAASQSVTIGTEALEAGITTIDGTLSAQDVTVVVQAGYTAGLTVLTTTADNSITGGAGNDIIVTNASTQLNFTATGDDSVTGGAGTDQIRIDNDSSTDGTGNAVTITVGSGLVSGVEQFVINDTSSDNAAGDVTVTFVAGYAVTTGLTIDGSALDAGEVLTVDTSANTTSESVTIIGGAADDAFTLSSIADSVTGGAGNDTFTLAIANLASNDSIQGGSGSADAITFTTAANIADTVFTNVTEVERLNLASGSATYNLGAEAKEAGITTVVASGVGDTTVTINAGGYGTTAISLSVSTGTTNDDTAFNIFGGSGNDTINLNNSYGTGNDFVQGGAGADTITLGDVTSATSADTVRINLGSELASGTTVSAADTYNAWQDGADLIEFVGATLASGGGGQVVLSTTLDDLNTAADVYLVPTLGELATFNAGGVGSAYIIVLDDVAGLAGTAGNGFTGGASAATAQGAIDAAVTYLTGNSIASTTAANINVILAVSVDTDNNGASNGVALFQYQEGGLDAGIQASELTLIGILNGVDVDNLTIADFK